jgi:hypothetical protein
MTGKRQQSKGIILLGHYYAIVNAIVHIFKRPFGFFAVLFGLSAPGEADVRKPSGSRS